MSNEWPLGQNPLEEAHYRREPDRLGKKLLNVILT